MSRVGRMFVGLAALKAVNGITREPPGMESSLADQLAYASEIVRKGRFNHTAASDRERLKPLREDEKFVDLVRDKMKSSLGRTPDITVQCDAEVKALAFTVYEDRAELVAVFRSGVVGALTGPHSISSYLEIACTCHGGTATNVTVGSLYATALKRVRDPRLGVSLHQINRAQ